MKLTALTPCYQTHDKALFYQVTIRRGWESWMKPHSWKQCHMPCSPVLNNLMLLCTCYRGGGGGLVAKSCLTLATPWTVDCILALGFDSRPLSGPSVSQIQEPCHVSPLDLACGLLAHVPFLLLFVHIVFCVCVCVCVFPSDIFI